ncbi:hypothetical protein BGW36DRAFT_388542 [Talaromyces proteolyticus]|uniref:Heme-binding protein n=1 Tax=Talaromyces proteolyticus TaxID=1131652 RepID=A0AAD4KGG1_9EURO|nr:uncharacterized protein BGW36DRAFT_388542 [Talaromyces proteolyticus]KAH8691544.1 hypothetical protein BGW36DRAFT_388542 [Talaromyces proteolyticus]
MEQVPVNPTPSQIPDRNLFEFPYGPPISLDEAKALIAASETAAIARGLRMCLVVLDSGGNLVAFERMDGALLISVDAAREKARAAVLMKAPSKAAETIVASGGLGLTYLSTGVMAVRGGMPLIRNGQVIGSFGASGGSLEDDEHISWVGATALRRL